MESGKLRHLLTIEEFTEVRDSLGTPTGTWATFNQPYGSIRFLRGNELFAAQQLHAEAIAEIRIRYVAGVTEKMRISFDSQVYNILFINNVDYRNRELRIMVSTGLRD